MLLDLLGQLFVLRRVDDVDTRPKHRDGPSAGVQGRPMRYGVDATGQPTDDGDSLPGEVSSQMTGHLATVGRGLALAHHRDGPAVLWQQRAFHEEDWWRVRDVGQQLGVRSVVPGDGLDSRALQPRQLLLGLDPAAHGGYGVDDTGVQARGPQFTSPGAPGLLHGAKVLLQQREAHPADRRYPAEGHPICKFTFHDSLLIRHFKGAFTNRYSCYGTTGPVIAPASFFDN